MNSNLLFNFTVDKENNAIRVTRAFDASLDLVWQAWTTAELLDQWWAPKPYRTETKALDFTEGGQWHYAMISPEGDKHWCLADYKTIDPSKSYTALDAFCDEAGNMNTDMPRTLWTNVFAAGNNTTTVNVTLQYQSLADLEKVVAMGMQEGFTMALGNLDELLSTIKK
jgi:uncharacterized protein YndB with AHSA1/START domain